MDLKFCLLVFMGGGLGSLTRYLLTYFLPNSSVFPWATWVANMLACGILGGFMAWMLSKTGLNETYRLLYITGFCGGLSTFSTFTWELMFWLQQGKWIQALVYLFLSCLLGLLIMFGSWKVAQL